MSFFRILPRAEQDISSEAALLLLFLPASLLANVVSLTLLIFHLSKGC